MRIGAAGDEIGAALLQTAGERLRVSNHRLGIGFEFGLQRLVEGDRLGGDDVHQRSALKSWEHRRVDLLGDRFVVGQDHAPARPAQGLVRRGRDDMGVAERRRMFARRDQPGKMRHVDEQQSADLVADRAKAGEVELPRIGRSAGDDHLGPMLFRQAFDLVEIDQMIVPAHAILNRVEPFARLRRRGAVGQVAAGGEAEAHDRVAGLEQRHHHRAIGLRAGMRLDVGELAAEQFLGSLDGQRLDRVGRGAALVIAAAGIAFGIFVGEHRALRLEHRAADDIFRSDELDLGLLAGQLVTNRILDRRVGFAQATGEKAVRHAIILVRFKVGGSGHQCDSCKIWESWSTRRW